MRARTQVQNPGVPEEQFAHMLAAGAIHPRGVVLDSEFFELPLRFDEKLLRAEFEALTSSGGWERSKKENVAQGVVSEHFRLTRALGSGDLQGPFGEVDDRLSPTRARYTRRALGSFGSVIGNVAYMSLPPNGLPPA
jgi:hypothetical protein